MFARTGFEGHLGQLLMALSIWAALKSHRQSRYLYLSVLLAVVATYTYFSVRFVWPVVFVAAQLLWTRLSVKTWLKDLYALLATTVLPVVVFAILLLPMLRSPFYAASNQIRLSADSIFNTHDYPVEANVLRQKAGNQFIDRVIYHRYWLLTRELLRNYADHLNFNFLFLTGDPNLRHGTGEHGLFLLPFLPFLLIGIYRLVSRQPRSLALLIIWWLAALLPASVPETTPHALRSLNALIPISILIGYGLQQSLLMMPKYRPHLTGLLVLILSLSFYSFWHQYLTHYPADSAYEWQEGYQQIAEAILAEKSKVDEIRVEPLARLYLWIMAYDGTNQLDWSKLQSQDFGFSDLNNIYFKSHDWQILKQEDRRFMLVGRPGYLAEELATTDRLPIRKYEIKSSTGELLFVGLVY